MAAGRPWSPRRLAPPEAALPAPVPRPGLEPQPARRPPGRSRSSRRPRPTRRVRERSTVGARPALPRTGRVARRAPRSSEHPREAPLAPSSIGPLRAGPMTGRPWGAPRAVRPPAWRRVHPNRPRVGPGPERRRVGSTRERTVRPRPRRVDSRTARGPGVLPILLRPARQPGRPAATAERPRTARAPRWAARRARASPTSGRLRGSAAVRSASPSWDWSRRAREKKRAQEPPVAPSREKSRAARRRRAKQAIPTHPGPACPAAWRRPIQARREAEPPWSAPPWRVGQVRAAPTSRRLPRSG